MPQHNTVTVLHSNRTVLPQGLLPAYVSISEGRIIAVSDTLPALPAGELVELGNSILMPGVIDPHVHINEPGRTAWEGFDTIGKAALAGGITTLVDMPLNASPVTTTATAFDVKLKAADTLHTHTGFWAGLVPGNSQEIPELINKGVLGFKAFLTHSGIDEFPNVTEDDLRLAMPRLAAAGLPLLVHAELTDEDTRHSGSPLAYDSYLASRPESWELNAIGLMIRLCEIFNCRVHIVHLSAASALPMIREAKARGLPVTVETGQHYLYFNAEQIPDGATQFKCAPPIRSGTNNLLLWEALLDGTIDLVATDHSPAPPDLKHTHTGDFRAAWGGISSVQFALPALWTVAARYNTPVERLATWLCTAPAKLIGKSETKGNIAIGYDADLVVWDDLGTQRVTDTVIQHRHKLTPYLGEQLSGIVQQTWLAGVKVFDNGSILTGHGDVLLR